MYIYIYIYIYIYNFLSKIMTGTKSITGKIVPFSRRYSERS